MEIEADDYGRDFYEEFAFMKCLAVLQNEGVITNLLTSFCGTRFSNLIFRTFILILPVFFFGSLARAQTPGVFSPSVSIRDYATGSNEKPVLLFDQDTAGPKGRLTLQRSSTDPGWSGLVLGINANWDTSFGYIKDVSARSQSFLQMEYEWDTGRGFRQNELNWTTAGRRIFNMIGKSDGFPDLAILGLMAPVVVEVPQSDASSYGQPDPTGMWDPNHNHGTGTNSIAALAVESYQGVGSATQVLIQNANHNSPAAASQIYFRGVGSGGYPGFATSWAIGTDRYWTGTNNFCIYDGKRNADALFIDQAGKVGIGTAQPQKTLDVNGSITIGHGAATWTQGNTAPTANEPDGSLYSRVNSGVNSGLYVRENGVWVRK
jgi:hypothetical protein